MHHVRRWIAILITSLASLTAAATVAYAQLPPDLVGNDTSAGISTSESAGTPVWEFLGLVAVGVLLAVAIVGLGYSLSHSRKSDHSGSQPAQHA
jgi:hypothetical protein